MIPTKGRTVIVLGIYSNGSDEHPAVITRAWSRNDTRTDPAAVNLTVFPDCAQPTHRASVMLYDNAVQARAAQNGNAHQVVAHWPEVAPAPAAASMPIQPPRAAAA